MEHPGGITAWKQQVHSIFLAGIDYVSIPISPTSAGEIVDIIQQAFEGKPPGYYVSISHVLATTGLVIPLHRIKPVTENHGALLIVDGAQSAGNVVDWNLRKTGADAYTISGHKGMLGPPGPGFLNIRKGAQQRIQPGMLQNGYGGYEHSSGTTPFVNMLGLGYSLEFLQRIGVFFCGCSAWARIGVPNPKGDTVFVGTFCWFGTVVTKLHP